MFLLLSSLFLRIPGKMSRALTNSPMKSGWMLLSMATAAVAAAVDSNMEATAQRAESRPGQKMAAVSGRKMPPPRSAIDR